MSTEKYQPPTKRDLYRLALRLADKRKYTTKIENDSTTNSIDVYERFFISCSKEICIVARGIKEAIFSDENITKSAVEFLKKTNSKLNIILLRETDNDFNCIAESSFVEKIKEFKNKINIYLYRENKITKKQLGSFTYGDDSIYRIRHKQEQEIFYKNNSHATVCFNDTNAVRRLKTKVENTFPIEQAEKKYEFSD